MELRSRIFTQPWLLLPCCDLAKGYALLVLVARPHPLRCKVLNLSQVRGLNHEQDKQTSLEVRECAVRLVQEHRVAEPTNHFRYADLRI